MEKTTIAPAIKPMIIESIIPTTSAPAVIPTRPASIPFNAIERSGFLQAMYENTIDDTAPDAAANAVVTQT